MPESIRSPASSDHSSAAGPGRSSATMTRNGSGQFSDSSVSYTAPTAPYKGEDGVGFECRVFGRREMGWGGLLSRVLVYSLKLVLQPVATVRA